DVGLEQRAANLAQRRIDVRFAQRAAAREAFENPAKPFAKALEHSLSFPGWSPGYGSSSHLCRAREPEKPQGHLSGSRSVGRKRQTHPGAHRAAGCLPWGSLYTFAGPVRRFRSNLSEVGGSLWANRGGVKE